MNFKVLAKFIISRVPRVFMKTAYFRGSSKRTLAAEWKIIETFFMRLTSVVDMPRFFSATSPVMGISLLKRSGL